ncbi:MAG: low molecular weight phosphotyrosine protein phosphatase [Spirochaetes bacterium]|nr:low molecular weight phosphotyrosine protein phosphatase [Spirochaetota bacterium]
MQSVLFVCLGNICRSPLAQGIFEKHIRAAGRDAAYDADSAGTSGWHAGEKPHSGSIAVAQKYGVSIEKQRSRPVHAKDGEIFDYILAMDSANRAALLGEFHFPQEKIFLMRDFAVDGKKGLSVPDPWGHGSDAFEEVYRILDAAILGFVAYLQQKR